MSWRIRTVFLLTLVFAVSLLWHWPAARLVPHLPLPPGLVLSQLHGSWHDARAQLIWHGTPLGEVWWRWAGFGQWGMPRVRMGWQWGDQRLEVSLRTGWNALFLERLSGQVDVGMVMKTLLSDSDAYEGLVKGRLHVDRLRGRWPWQAAWPSAMTGHGQVMSLSVLGTALPLMRWQMAQRGKALVWQARGTASWGEIRASASVDPSRYSVEVAVSGGKTPPPQALIGLLQPVGDQRWRGVFSGVWR